MADPILKQTLPLQILNGTQQADRAQRVLNAKSRLSSERMDSELEQACQDMESIFLNYLLKEMRATINRSGFVSGGTAEDIFTSMLDTELSKGMAARGGIGLSQILIDQLGNKAEEKDGQTR